MKLPIFLTLLTAPLWLSTTALAQIPVKSQQTPPVLLSQSDWREFSSTEGKFAVSLPGTPKRETEKNDDGTLSYMFTLEVEEPASAYLVSYSDIPDVELLNPEGIKKVLDDAISEFAKGGNATVQGQKEVSLGGNPGREFDFTSTEGFSGKGRLYVVQKRMYIVVAIAPEINSSPQTQNAQRFLESFRLL
jgi:hypothetical protein